MWKRKYFVRGKGKIKRKKIVRQQHKTVKIITIVLKGIKTKRFLPFSFLLPGNRRSEVLYFLLTINLKRKNDGHTLLVWWIAESCGVLVTWARVRTLIWKRGRGKKKKNNKTWPPLVGFNNPTVRWLITLNYNATTVHRTTHSTLHVHTHPLSGVSDIQLWNQPLNMECFRSGKGRSIDRCLPT